MQRFLIGMAMLCLLSTRKLAYSNNSVLADSSIYQYATLPKKYYVDVNSKVTKVQHDVDKRTIKALDRLIVQEKGMQKKLSAIDSAAAKRIFAHSIDSLNNLKQHFLNKSNKYTKVIGIDYNGYLDTLQTSLSFLKSTDKVKGIQKELASSVSEKVNQMQGKFQEAAKIETYIRERKHVLISQLSQYNSFSKKLQQYNKEAYYYSQQLKEYKAVLKNRKKAETAAMQVLKKTPAFNKYLASNSLLAGLFNSSFPDTTKISQQLEGIQSRSQVEDAIQKKMAGNQQAMAAVNAQLSQARQQFDQLKNKYSQVGSTADMPDFKPNEMKNKSFLQRLEFGANVQFEKSNQWYPSTSDFAGQVSYKFTMHGSVGIGASYKLGWGENIDHIKFSHRGAGLRSFIEWQIKKTFYINGGFEENYNVTFSNLFEITSWSGWQGSALLGISKKYKISGKLKGNIILLYDFLSANQIPHTNPIKIRVGYNF